MPDVEHREEAPAALPPSTLQAEKAFDQASRRSLWASAGACIALAVFFYLLASYLHTWKLEWPAAIAEHLSTAFWVGLISIVGLEYNAHKRAHREHARWRLEFDQYRKHVAEDVFEAVLGRIVQKPIVEEIKSILRMPFIKTECEYTIRFLEPYPEMPSGYGVLRRDLSFVVTNLSEEPATFPVRSSYTNDEELADAAWGGRPFHLQLEVDEVPIPPGEFLKDEQGFTMDYPVVLEPHESKKIFLRGEEPMRIEASRSYYQQSTPVDAIVVVIENNHGKAIRDVEVQMHHPGRGQVKHDRSRARYLLKRAFLPGQGFEVVWKQVEPRPAIVKPAMTTEQGRLTFPGARAK